VSSDSWPSDFQFGVATAGFQIEGGYNRPGEPRNNWAMWEDAGRVSRAGDANRFWEHFEQQVDLVVAMGLSSFRLSIEWTRCEPREGEIDESAVERYREILAAVRTRGLRALVTLHHFTNPEWLGRDPWLDDVGWRKLAEWYAFAASRFGDLCDEWITSNEINIFAVNTYFHGIFPPGRRGDLTATMSCIDHLLCAHIVGYQEIKQRWPNATVATNNYSFSIYELDRLILDTLHAKMHNVADDERATWLHARREEHYRQVPTAKAPFRTLETFLRAWAARKIPLEGALANSRREITRATTPRLLDVAQLDYYAPTVAEHITLPGKRTAGGQWWKLGRPLWDDRPDPAMFLAYVLEAAQDGLPVWVVENGMCVRRDERGAWPRRDGWTRERYLRENIGALVSARRLGANVTGYWHWTLIDNFEWGSYQPRFGLHGLASDGSFLATDSSGDNIAGIYREIATSLARSDFSAVRLVQGTR
jgi:beta-glucosidase/6-phospho-beta-glucosidase/beta-galactosidase